MAFITEVAIIASSYSVDAFMVNEFAFVASSTAIKPSTSAFSSFVFIVPVS